MNYTKRIFLRVFFGLCSSVLAQSSTCFKKRTAGRRITPEQGKNEGVMAAKYGLRKYPSVFMIDKPFAKSRKIDLIFWSFGKMKTLSAKKTLLEIARGMAPQQIQQVGGVQTPRDCVHQNLNLKLET